MVSFFLSSRRRHTRWTGDWSSDVCSSDLSRGPHPDEHLHEVGAAQAEEGDAGLAEIGRASCREREEISVVVHLQKEDAIRQNSVGMTKLLEDLFGAEITICRYGQEESNGH